MIEIPQQVKDHAWKVVLALLVLICGWLGLKMLPDGEPTPVETVVPELQVIEPDGLSE